MSSLTRAAPAEFLGHVCLSGWVHTWSSLPEGLAATLISIPVGRRTWRLHVLARSMSYGYAAMLPFQIYGWVGVMLSPNVGSLFGTENPLFLVPIGLVLNTPYALVIAAMLITVIYTTELIARRNRVIAHATLIALFLVPAVDQLLTSAADPRIGVDRWVALDLPTLSILYLAATWELTRTKKIHDQERARQLPDR